MSVTRKAFIMSSVAVAVAAPIMPTLCNAQGLPFRAVKIAATTISKWVSPSPSSTLIPNHQPTS